MKAMSLKLVFLEQDLKQLLVGLFVSLLDPLLKFIYIKAVMLGSKRFLLAHIEHPVLFHAAPPDKVDGLAGLEDLICEPVA